MRTCHPGAHLVHDWRELPVSRTTARSVRRVILLLLAAALIATTCAAALPRDGYPPWLSPGLIGNGGWPFARAPVGPEEATGASYIPGSAVLALPHGKAR